MSGNGKKNITATILEKVARNSVKAAADRDQEAFQIRKLHTKKILPYMWGNLHIWQCFWERGSVDSIWT